MVLPTAPILCYGQMVHNIIIKILEIILVIIEIRVLIIIIEIILERLSRKDQGTFQLNRNNSKNGRSYSRSYSQNRSSSRSGLFIKKIWVPAFGGVSCGVHSFSATPFQITLSFKNNSDIKYTAAVDSCILALYYTVFAKLAGRTLQNKKIYNNKNKNLTLEEIVDQSLRSIFGKIPTGHREPDEELLHRLCDLFGLFYTWVNEHGYSAEGRKLYPIF